MRTFFSVPTRIFVWSEEPIPFPASTPKLSLELVRGPCPLTLINSL